MSVLWLKILAVLSMTADHVNKSFWLENPFLTVFGRVAFPLFCYLSSVGFRKTRNKPRYLIRLFLCALVSEIPFDLLWYGKVFELSGQNVCFTLFLGGLACVVYDSFERKTSDIHKSIGLISAVLIIVSASLIGSDYGLFGSGLLFFLYLFPQNNGMQIIGIFLFDFLLCGANSRNISDFISQTQHFSLLSIPFIVFSSEKRTRLQNNPALKYLFYIYYPAHMAFLYALKTII